MIVGVVLMIIADAVAVMREEVVLLPAVRWMTDIFAAGVDLVLPK